MIVGPSSWAAVVIAIVSAGDRRQVTKVAPELRAVTPAVIQFAGYGKYTGSVEQHSAEGGSIIGPSLVTSAWRGPLWQSVLSAVASREPCAAQLNGMLNLISL